MRRFFTNTPRRELERMQRESQPFNVLNLSNGQMKTQTGKSTIGLSAISVEQLYHETTDRLGRKCNVRNYVNIVMRRRYHEITTSLKEIVWRNTSHALRKPCCAESEIELVVAARQFSPPQLVRERSQAQQESPWSIRTQSNT